MWLYLQYRFQKSNMQPKNFVFVCSILFLYFILFCCSLLVVIVAVVIFIFICFFLNNLDFFSSIPMCLVTYVSWIWSVVGFNFLFLLLFPMHTNVIFRVWFCVRCSKHSNTNSDSNLERKNHVTKIIFVEITFHLAFNFLLIIFAIIHNWVRASIDAFL